MYQKITLIAILLLQFFSMPLNAQRGEKVEAIKIAYLSEKLDLDPKTAEKFWPIYNQYDDEMRQVIQQNRKANDNRSAEDILDQEQKAIDIKRKYSTLFSKVISNDQLAKMYKSEKEFHQILIRRMKNMETNKHRMQEGGNESIPLNRPRMNHGAQGGNENRPLRKGGR